MESVKIPYAFFVGYRLRNRPPDGNHGLYKYVEAGRAQKRGIFPLFTFSFFYGTL